MDTIKEVVEKHGLESPFDDRTIEQLIAEWLDKSYRARNGGLSSVEYLELEELESWINDGYIFVSKEDYWIDHD